MLNVLLKTKLRVNSDPTQYWSNSSSIQKYIFGRRIEGDKKTSAPTRFHRGPKKGRLTGRSGKGLFFRNEPVFIMNPIYTLIYLRKALYLIRHLTGEAHPVIMNRPQPGRSTRSALSASSEAGHYSGVNPRYDRIVFISIGLEPKLSSIVKLAAIRAGCRLMGSSSGRYDLKASSGPFGGAVSLLVIFNPNKNEMLIKEAKKKKIPVIAFIGREASPDITIPIPANVERSSSLSLMANLLANAIIDRGRGEKRGRYDREL
jgi:hypothetical protein